MRKQPHELNKQYKEYIDRLKTNGVDLHDYNCPYCGLIIQTAKNTSQRDWDTIECCPHCDGTYMKLTLANGGGVAIHLSNGKG